VLDVAAGAAAELDALDAAELDDDELDPHPTMTNTIIATPIAPAPMRTRPNLNMGLSSSSRYASPGPIRPARRKETGLISLQQVLADERLRYSDRRLRNLDSP
jgi:hypothetical protein